MKDRWGQDTPRTGAEALRLSDEDAAIWTDVDGPTTGDPFNEWLSADQN